MHPPTCLGLRRTTTDFCRRRGRVAAANRISAVKLSIKKFFTNSAIGHERFLKTRRYLASFQRHESRAELICNIRNGNGKVGFGCPIRLSFFERAITKKQQSWKNLDAAKLSMQEFPPSPSRRINRYLLILPCTDSRK